MHKFKRTIKEYLLDKWWNFKSRNIANPLLPNNPYSFLFICKGNVCRSPFAEYLTLKELNNENLSVASVGLQVNISNPPPQEALQAATSFGIDLSTHQSKEIDPNNLSSFDMILLMEYNHLIELQDRCPALSDRMFLLPLFDNTPNKRLNGYDRCNIHDPYGKNVQAFNECFARIDRCIKKLFASIS